MSNNPVLEGLYEAARSYYRNTGRPLMSASVSFDEWVSIEKSMHGMARYVVGCDGRTKGIVLHVAGSELKVFADSGSASGLNLFDVASVLRLIADALEGRRNAL